MPRSELRRRGLLAFLAVFLVAGWSVSPAAAQSPDSSTRSETSQQDREPTPEQEAQALKQARDAAGERVCEPLKWALTEDYETKCGAAAGVVFSPEGKQVTALVVCDVIIGVEGIPLLGGACESAVKDSMLAAQVVFTETYQSALVKLVATTAGPVLDAVSFVADPLGGIDDFANATKESTTSATETIFTKMTETSSVDLGAPWWQQEYARAAGLGLVVMTILLLVMVRDVSAGKMSADELADSVFALAPVGVILMVFSPSIGAAIAALADALTLGIAEYTADGIGTFTGGTTQALWSITAGGLPGGQLVGIVLFGLMLFGAVATLVGFIVQEFAMYASAVALAIAWGMMIHPTWRQKTRKLIAFWIATAMMKPALMLTLGLAFSFLNAQAFEVENGFGAFSALLTTGMVLCLVGASPWVLLKYIPLLPSGNEYSQAPSGGTSNALAGAAAGVMSSWAMSRYHSAQSSSASRNQQTSTGSSSQANAGPSAATGQEGDGSNAGGWQARSSMPPPSGQSKAGPSTPHGQGQSGTTPGSGAGASAGAGTSTTGAAAGGAKPAAAAGRTAGVAGIAIQAGIGVANAGLSETQKTAQEFDPQMREGTEK